MMHFGQKPTDIFRDVKETGTGYDVTMRDGFKLSLSRDEVRQAATAALTQIREKFETPSGPEEGLMEPTVRLGETADPPAERPALAVEANAEEAEIFVLMAQGHREQAKHRLVELIAATARAGNFSEAERLRERMYEIDPMALAEIIRTGEIMHTPPCFGVGPTLMTRAPKSASQRDVRAAGPTLARSRTMPRLLRLTPR